MWPWLRSLRGDHGTTDSDDDSHRALRGKVMPAPASWRQELGDVRPAARNLLCAGMGTAGSG